MDIDARRYSSKYIIVVGKDAIKYRSTLEKIGGTYTNLIAEFNPCWSFPDEYIDIVVSTVKKIKIIIYKRFYDFK